MLKPKQRHPAQERETVWKAYRERMSLRGVERVFDVGRQTVMRWVEQAVAVLPRLADTLLPVQPGDGLAADEAWSFVGRRDQKRWLWTVLCRRARQIVAFALGDRSGDPCRRLWPAIPEPYQRCQSFSDFWKTYASVFPAETHQSVGKETGQPAHQERWYNTLRRWLGRYTRRTLDFSKTDFHHELVTRWFIIEYNLRMRPSLTT